MRLALASVGPRAGELGSGKFAVRDVGSVDVAVDPPVVVEYLGFA